MLHQGLPCNEIHMHLCFHLLPLFLLPSCSLISPTSLFSLPPSFLPSLPSHQFTMMNMSMFKEIFAVEVEYLVERIQSNYALQIIPNSFLANSTTSPTFATILLNFLMER